MNSFGAVLRNERETKSLSLNQVENDIKVRMKYLQALEDENLDPLPGKTYAIGFLKLYAKYLGLDEQDLLDKLKKLYADSQPLETENLPPQPLPIKTNYNKRGLFYAVAALFVLLFIYVIYNNNSDTYTGRQAVENNPAAKTSVKMIKTDSKAISKPTNDAVYTQDVQQLNTVPVLKLQAVNGNSWIKVTVDNKVAYQGYLNQGEIKTYTGKVIKLKLGNAGAVQVTYNNLMNYLGGNGQVVTKTFAQ